LAVSDTPRHEVLPQVPFAISGPILVKRQAFERAADAHGEARFLFDTGLLRRLNFRPYAKLPEGGRFWLAPLTTSATKRGPPLKVAQIEELKRTLPGRRQRAESIYGLNSFESVVIDRVTRQD
jgi:hypothetical protein